MMIATDNDINVSMRSLPLAQRSRNRSSMKASAAVATPPASTASNQLPLNFITDRPMNPPAM